MRKTQNFIFAFAFEFFILNCAFLNAQNVTNSQVNIENSKQKNYWIDLGIGASTFANSKWITHVNLSVQPVKKGIISFRFLQSWKIAEGTFFVPKIFGPSLSEKIEDIWDFGILYGFIVHETSKGFVSLSGGIGGVGGVQPVECVKNEERAIFFTPLYKSCKKDDFFTIGIPLQTQLVVIPFPYVGIGISGFANLNMEKSFHGFLLGLQIGKLR